MEPSVLCVGTRLGSCYAHHALPRSRPRIRGRPRVSGALQKFFNSGRRAFSDRLPIIGAERATSRIRVPSGSVALRICLARDSKTRAKTCHECFLADSSTVRRDEQVNYPLTEQKWSVVRNSAKRGDPLGKIEWGASTVNHLGLQSPLSPRGRPHVKNPHSIDGNEL